jgi:Zn-dependent peptidase ImmA (M78 family)
MKDSSALADLEAAVELLLVRAGLPPGHPDLLNAVAEVLGLSVREHRGVAEGRLCLRDGQAVIEVHPYASAARRRFTLAHEIGHAFLLHPARDLDGTICRRWRSEEAFCNDFAAALLLPRSWLEVQLGDSGASLKLLGDIAHASGTSLSACGLRLVRTGLWNHALLEWRHDSDELRLRSRGPLNRETGARLLIDYSTLRNVRSRCASSNQRDGWQLLAVSDSGRPRRVWAQARAWRDGLLALVGLRSDDRGRYTLAWHSPPAQASRHVQGVGRVESKRADPPPGDARRQTDPRISR